ncbi:MAG: hypothetical protein B6242_03665 [Anaerolineaceae bacterium 4572_78]|nr:MAG: hypothetical protein B6242_03665 [Anaerolineaceae bacterium 4572_78]
MQTYHFDEFVNDEGIVTLTGLPPSTKVAILVIRPEPFDWQKEIKEWIEEMKQHPFAQMSKEEVMACLRQSRDKIYEEDYGYRHAH